MSTITTPFIKWGDYKSPSSNNPDILELEVKSTETFDTSLSICVVVLQKIGNVWEERILPLKSYESRNNTLHKLWTKNVRNGKLMQGKKFTIKTYLGTSKYNRTIRRFDLVV